jgi:cytochrome P450
MDTHDKRWKRHRKLLQPAFGPTHLRHGAYITNDVMELVDKKMDLEYALAGKTCVKIDIHSLCTGITLDIIGRLCFNKPMHGINNMGQKSVCCY